MRCRKSVRIVVFIVRHAMVLKVSIAYLAKITKRSSTAIVWIVVGLGFLLILMITVNHVIFNVPLVKGLKIFV